MKNVFNRTYTKVIMVVAVTASVLLAPATAFAHSKVIPGETGMAKDETFTVVVENEKDIPTVQVRLVLPEGLSGVEAYAKNGWNVEMTGEPEVQQLTWTGGTISGELKDTFSFDAKVPAKETKLTWKIYQTYQDGSTVAWENTDPSAGDKEGENTGPASYTQVVDDFAKADANTDNGTNRLFTMLAFVFGMLGFITGGIALSRKPAKQ